MNRKNGLELISDSLLISKDELLEFFSKSKKTEILSLFSNSSGLDDYIHIVAGDLYNQLDNNTVPDYKFDKNGVTFSMSDISRFISELEDNKLKIFMLFELQAFFEKIEKHNLEQEFNNSKVILEKYVKDMELLEGLSRNISDAFYIKTLNKEKNAFNFTYINEQQRRFLNRLTGEEYIIEGLLNKCDVDFFSGEFSNKTFEDELKLYNGETEFLDEEEKHISPSGEVCYVSTKKIPLYGDNGNIIGIGGVNRDITKQKEMHIENQLLQLKNEMLFKIMTHDFSNYIGKIKVPLDALSQNLDLASACILDFEKLLKTMKGLVEDKLGSPFCDDGIFSKLETIKDNLQIDIKEKGVDKLNKLMTIIHDLFRDNLRVIAMNSNKSDIEIASFDIKNLVEQQKNTYDILAREDNVDIIIDCPVNYKLDGNMDIIGFVVRNLIQNAIKFSKKDGNGVVNISCKEDGLGNVLVSVQDNGLGMSQDAIKNILNNVGGINKSGRGNDGKKSSGIGLGTVTQMLAFHDQNLMVDSQIDAGSIFSFYLPLSKEKQHKTINSLEQLKPFEICHIDDEIIITTLLFKRFSENSKKHSVFNNADKFLENLKNNNADIFIIDLHITAPNACITDGNIVAQNIRAKYKDSLISPIIILNSGSEGDKSQQGLFDFKVLKPFHFDNFIQGLNNLDADKYSRFWEKLSD